MRTKNAFAAGGGGVIKSLDSGCCNASRRS